MNWAVKVYLFMRGLRWLAWIAFLLYSLHYVLVPAQHLDQFGHLLPTTETTVFGLAILAVFLGFFELMARGNAGLQQPDFAQLVPPVATSRLPDR